MRWRDSLRKKMKCHFFLNNTSRVLLIGIPVIFARSSGNHITHALNRFNVFYGISFYRMTETNEMTNVMNKVIPHVFDDIIVADILYLLIVIEER